MKMRNVNSTVLGIMFLLGAAQPHDALGQLLGNVNINQGVDADNDFPPDGASTQSSVSDTLVPFQKTISANDGTGSMVSGTFGLTDEAEQAVFTISASGVLTANGNDFGADSLPASTYFQLLEPASYSV